jgi:hypothetical protein
MLGCIEVAALRRARGGELASSVALRKSRPCVLRRRAIARDAAIARRDDPPHGARPHRACRDREGTVTAPAGEQRLRHPARSLAEHRVERRALEQWSQHVGGIGGQRTRERPRRDRGEHRRADDGFGCLARGAIDRIPPATWRGRPTR